MAFSLWAWTTCPVTLLAVTTHAPTVSVKAGASAVRCSITSGERDWIRVRVRVNQTDRQLDGKRGAPIRTACLYQMSLDPCPQCFSDAARLSASNGQPSRESADVAPMKDAHRKLASCTYGCHPYVRNICLCHTRTEQSMPSEPWPSGLTVDPLNYVNDSSQG